MHRRQLMGNCGIPGEGRAVWERAAASLHQDVVSDSKERHERTPRCSSAQVAGAGGVEMAGKASCWVGMPLTGGMEGRSALCGNKLLDMDRCDYRAGDRSGGCFMWPTHSSVVVSQKVVWAWATHVNVSGRISQVPCGYLEHRRRVQLEGCVAQPLQTITASLVGSKWSFLLPRICAARCLEWSCVSVPAHEAAGVCGQK